MVGSCGPGSGDIFNCLAMQISFSITSSYPWETLTLNLFNDL